MIPGLAVATEALLLALLDPRSTTITSADLAALPYTLLNAFDDNLSSIGVHCSGPGDLTVIVTDPARAIGRLEINVAAPGCVLFLDNRAAAGNLHGNIRVLGRDCALLFNDLGEGYIALQDVLMRSANQILFWGRGATAVGCSFEIEGSGRSVVIGDDALISAGIWIRNHDMHATHDMRTGERINRMPVDTVLERHVWLGQNAMLLNCQRIGRGSIVGAQALVKGVVGSCVAVGGVPAKVIRYDVSWGRDLAGMSDIEIACIKGTL